MRIVMILTLGISVAGLCFAQYDPKSTASSMGRVSSISGNINSENNGGSGDYGYNRNNGANESITKNPLDQSAGHY